MSIATLKRKTLNGNPRMAPISGNRPLGFALNGTRRITGVVGPTNLGHTGKYSNSCCNETLCSNENCNIVKPSVKNTKGMLSVRYNGLSCNNNCPKIWVQPMDTGDIKHHTQGQYISSKSAECYIHKTSTKEIKNCPKNCNLNTYVKPRNFIGTKKIFDGKYTKNSNGAMTQAEYITLRLRNNKSYSMAKSDTCKNPYKPHFPPNVNNKGCNTYYKTYEEAKAAGLYGKI